MALLKLHMSPAALLILTIVAVSACTPLVIDETENASVNTIVINEIMANNTHSGLDPYFKNFVDWIEIYNAGDEIIDLSDHYITDNLNNKTKWHFPPDSVVNPGAFLMIWADGLDIYDHANFKLERAGEEVAVFNSQGVLVDHVEFGEQVSDVSYGRVSDGSDEWRYLSQPSPGHPNIGPGVDDPVTAPSVLFSTEAGFHNGAISLELMIGNTVDSQSAANASAQIKYTLDGSLPGLESPTYSEPLLIQSTTVVRARVFADLVLPGPVTTRTYLIDENTSLPVVSLATDPGYFFDEDTGIYVKGRDWLPDPPYYGANFHEDWERPVNFEFFENNGVAALNMYTGIKIYGGDSVGNEQKSLAIYARDKYGEVAISYPFFGDRELSRYRRLVLRNSGQDWASTMLRDGYMQSLIAGQMDIDYQSYRPAIVFLNGQYWGIHNLREKMDDDYIESHYGLTGEQTDFLYHYGGEILVSWGDKSHYDALLAYMDTHDMSLSESYEYVNARMDLDEYLNYVIAQMFWVNTAWPSENTKLWRPKTEDGRWRWLLYDTDFGFGLYHSYHKDMIEHCTATDGPEWPNPPWSTFLFRKLLENPVFRDEFIQRFAGHLNTTFSTERTTAFIDLISGAIRQEMARDITKWGGIMDEMLMISFPASLAQWEVNIDVMRQFALRRPEYARLHLETFFGLSGSVRLSFNNAHLSGGTIFVNGVKIPTGDFSGRWFKDVPVRIQAFANKGYRFAGWNGLPVRIEAGTTQTYTSAISVRFEQDSEIQAVFVPMTK